MKRKAPSGRAERGFTLIELLTVIAIIAILVALVLPTLAAAKNSGYKAACLSNLRQIGVAIHTYADDYAGCIPFGPTAPAFTSPADFYPTTGSPTSLLSLRSGAPAALGLLLKKYLDAQPKVLFCPGGDQKLDADAELAKVGQSQAAGSYFYRHAGMTQLFDGETSGPPEHIRLDNLGKNRRGNPIRALAIDSDFLCPPGLEAFGVKTRTHHRERFANVLFSDGHVTSYPNREGKYSVDVRNYSELRQAFEKILKVLELADEGG